jgi:hypothetical protein
MIRIHIGFPISKPDSLRIQTFSAPTYLDSRFRIKSNMLMQLGYQLPVQHLKQVYGRFEQNS